MPRLALGLSLAAGVATLLACVPSNPPQTPPRPVKPEDGPKGSIVVDYHGGEFTRQLQARFRLDRAGYVLVGHLGGDGHIRVLYPETPRSSGWVSGGKTVLLKPRAAMYDVSPHLFSFASTPWRSLSAQMDSYDGLGHGYVFMITSRFPIDYGAIRDRDGFEQLEIVDYDRSSDPRYAVRNLADDLVTGPYTLKFARDASGGAFARANACPRRWGLLGYSRFDYSPWLDLGYSYFTYPGISLLNGMAFARLYGLQQCRGSYYASGRFHGPTTLIIPVTGTPQQPLTPRLQRPTRRTLEDQERTAIISGRSALDRRGTLSTRGGGGVKSQARAIRPTLNRPDWSGEIDRSRPTSTAAYQPERAARPMDTPRMSTPSTHRPPTPTTTTAITPSSGGETRTERPRPQP
jgi:hypothetical protein